MSRRRQIHLPTDFGTKYKLVAAVHEGGEGPELRVPPPVHGQEPRHQGQQIQYPVSNPLLTLARKYHVMDTSIRKKQTFKIKILCACETECWLKKPILTNALVYVCAT